MANKRTRRDGTKTVATLIYLDEKKDAIAARIAEKRGAPWTKTSVLREILEGGLDREAEVAILGCALLDPDKCVPQILNQLTEDDFMDRKHKNILSCIRQMWGKKIPIDIITLHEHAKSSVTLDYIASLPDVIANTSALSIYIDEVLNA